MQWIPFFLKDAELCALKTVLSRLDTKQRTPPYWEDVLHSKEPYPTQLFFFPSQYTSILETLISKRFCMTYDIIFRKSRLFPPHKKKKEKKVYKMNINSSFSHLF